jgi:hypothetical protein
MLARGDAVAEGLAEAGAPPVTPSSPGVPPGSADAAGADGWVVVHGLGVGAVVRGEAGAVLVGGVAGRPAAGGMNV